MKRIGKRLVTGILMVLCALCLVLAACGGEEKIELSFETNGGSSIEAVYADKGETYTLPIPQREGFEFEGWYNNADFSGTAITEVVADVPTKFYAKWEKLYEIKLELDGGTLVAGKLYARVGDVIYDSVKDLAPTKEGWQFDDWYLGNTKLSRAAQMQEQDVTLTAHYKVGYTVEIYKQNTALNGYEKEEENYVGYAEITATPFTPNVAVTGFDLADPQPTDGAAPAIPSKVLTATPSDNVFRLYYDRKLVEVTFIPDYPDGQTGDPIQRSVRYGCETQLPDAEFSADGYFLYAWSAMDGEGNTTIVESDYIDTLLINGEDSEYSGKVTVGEYISFTARWSRGYTDLMRGVDRIYLFHEDDTVCYLERSGKYFKGEYRPNTRAVSFYDEYDNIKLEARLRTDGTFIYAVDTREEQMFDFYTIENGIDDTIQIQLDAYDGLTYWNGAARSRGTYTIDAENNYIVTFSEGELNGQTRALHLLQATVNGELKNLFQFRNEEEYEMPLLQRALVAEQLGTNTVTYYVNNILSIDLDGYGVAVMNVGNDETTSYYYSHTDDTLTLYNTSGRVYGVYKLITVETQRDGEVRCYIPYTEEMDVTYTAEGATLKLDGISEAVYTHGSTTVRGKYTYTPSLFGGYIITIAIDNTTQYVFLVKSESVQVGEETSVRHTFEERPKGYAEYYHTDGRYINFTPIIVMNETAEGKASVYGASGTSSQHEFHKVAEGTYTYNEQHKTYALTIDKTAGITYPEGIMETPVDLRDIESIVFGVNTVRKNTAVYAVTYWLEVTRTGGEAPSGDLTTTYTGRVMRGGNEVDATLSLVGGFAILKIGTEDWRVGSYSTSNGVTTVNIGLTETTSRFYVELNDGDTKTFTHLNKLLGSARERNADGTSNRDVTFEFDGKGGATLVTQQTGGDPIRVAGTIEEQDEIEGVEGTVYLFTPTDGGDAQAFSFVLLTSGSYTYFTRETKDYKGTYHETDGDGILTLDGFGFRGTFTVAGESEPLEGVYSIVDADQKIVRVMVGSDPYYFDISGQNYKVRGSEYGAYMFIVNYANNGYLLRLDGHGEATLEKEDTVVASGTYSEEKGVYTLNLTLETEVAGIETEYKGALGEVIQNNLRYDAFLVEFSNARNVYVDRTEWTVLVLDGFGNAVRYGQYGGGERGTYTVLTDSLIYYANSAGTDACIYQYSGNEMVGEIVMRTYTAQGYYTANLDALLFTKYGFMQFNGRTRYYYEMDSEENVTIYRRAFGEAGANEYGFLEIEIGQLGQKLDLSSHITEDFGKDLYYSADGYAISFTRETTDTNASGGLKYPVKVSKEDDTLYALEDLIFAPTGGASFTVGATVRINEKNYSGVIHRVAGEDGEDASAEWYLTIGNLRFDLELHYQGADDATYTIKQLRDIQVYQSNMYLDLYLMLLLMLGYQMPDSFGTITLVTEYNEDGTAGTEAGTQYITSAFGKGSALYGYELVKASYEYDEKTHNYTVELPEKKATSEEEVPAKESDDTHKYRLYFRLEYNSTYLQLGSVVAGYTILGYTREEELSADVENTHYTVTAERVLYGETNEHRAGDYYSVKLETGTDTKTPIAASDLLLPVGDALYYVVYTRAEDETKKITAAKYYELKFTEEDGGSIAEDEVKLLKSVTVREIDATVYYTDGGSYAEVIADEADKKKIVHVYYSQDYTVTECEYNAETKTFTVTTSTGRKLSIKITNEQEKTIEITEVTEEQA